MRTISAARKDEHDYAKSVGTTMAMKDGSKATCTAYHGVNNITVEFEDGFVLYHARWNQFVRGHPSPRREKHQQITEKPSDTQLAF